MNISLFAVLSFICLPTVLCTPDFWMIGSPMSAELQKASFTSSAEFDFFQILRPICPVFLQIFTKFKKKLPNFTIFYQIFQILPNFFKKYQIVQIFTKFMIYVVLSRFQIVVIYAFFFSQG